MKDVATVGDLRALIADRDDAEPIGVAACPDVNGFVQPLLGCVAEAEGMVVLALGENTLGEEMDLSFVNPEGESVRPV